MNQNDSTIEETLLFRSNGLNDEENAWIIESTNEYIITTERFIALLLWIHLSKWPLFLKSLIDSRWACVIVFSFSVVQYFISTFASDIAGLYGNDAFLILVLSTKKRYSSFLKKCLVFQKTCFKGKILKTLKFSTDRHIKIGRSINWRAILKIPSIVFYKNLCSLCWFFLKKLKEKAFSSVTQTPIHQIQLAKRSNHLFLLSIWWITSVLFNMS